MTDPTPATADAPAGRLGVSVIVLAGGRSSRFGSPKLDAILDGRPLLDHVVELGLALSDDVVVALPGPSAPNTNADAPTVPATVRTVRDPEAFGGPLVGLAAALAAVDREVAIVLGGDMPRLRVQLLEPMVIVLGSHADVDAVVLGHSGAPRPLPLVIRTSAARDAARTILDGTGEHSLRALLAALPSRTIDEAHWRALDPTGDALSDIDNPSDLAALRAQRLIRRVR